LVKNRKCKNLKSNENSKKELEGELLFYEFLERVNYRSVRLYMRIIYD